MSVHNLPARGSVSSLPTHDLRPSTDLTYAVPMEEEQEGINWARVLHALKRYKWLVLGVTVAGVAAGVVATRFVAADYSVESTLWVDQLSRRTAGEDVPRPGSGAPRGRKPA